MAAVGWIKHWYMYTTLTHRE